LFIGTNRPEETRNPETGNINFRAEAKTFIAEGNSFGAERKSVSAETKNVKAEG
jgi:hypothetical protein